MQKQSQNWPGVQYPLKERSGGREKGLKDGTYPGISHFQVSTPHVIIFPPFLKTNW